MLMVAHEFASNQAVSGTLLPATIWEDPQHTINVAILDLAAVFRTNPT